MHLELFARGVRDVVEAGGRWAVMLGRLLRMLRREELVHMIERGLRQFVVGDALRHAGMLVGVFGDWRGLRSFSCWTKKPRQYARIRCDYQW